MNYGSAEQALDALIHAYYTKRDVNAVLSCVTDDIEWVGTESNDSTSGKEQLKQLLDADITAFPKSFPIELEPPTVQALGRDCTLFTIVGKQCADDIALRGTVCCICTEQGWLANHVHASVPNSLLEKYALEKTLNENRKKEQLLLASIPGGVAMYRMKKNDRICTDFVSDGFAKLCGYDDANEFLAELKTNALFNVLTEDIPLIFEAAQKSLKTGQPISVRYHIHVKNQSDILIRLDANLIERELGEDDIAVWYAVHTIVSEESKEILRKQRYLSELIDTVPAGIGIYEIKNGRISQTYTNDAFYQMLGCNRENRTKYLGESTLQAMHPEDVKLVLSSMHTLMNGANTTNITYRLRMENGGWFWVNLNVAVVERKSNYLKLYAAFSDYNSIVQARQELEHTQNTLQAALQSAKVLAWRFDYTQARITDSGTLGNAFHLPKVMDNIPQSIIDMGFIAKSSEAAFRKLFDDVATEKIASADIESTINSEHGTAWFRQIYTPVFDEAGHYIDSIGIAIDITEQKLREHRYEELLQLSKAASQDALATASYNLTQNLVTEYNSTVPDLKNLLAYQTADELLASTKDTIFDSKEREKFRVVSNAHTMIQAFKSGTTHMEIKHHLKDSTHWLQTTFDMIENPYTGDIEAISAVYDITNMVRAELMVTQLLAVDYQSIMIIDTKNGTAIPFRQDKEDHNLNEVMALQSSTGSGAAGLEIFLRTYAVPGTAEQAIHENSMPFIQQKLEHAPYYECMYSLIQRGKRGRYRVIYSYLEANKATLLCAVQDVTDMYELEEKQKADLSLALKQAEAANKAKTAFLSRVSHDMRTPLNGILGLTTLLKDCMPNDKAAADLAELELSGKYLLNLINDTLDVSRIESGKLELHPVVYDGKTLLKNTLSLAKTTLGKKNVTVHVSEADIPYTTLFVDVGRLEQVVMNVFGNAVKFTPEGGCIDISLTNLRVENGVITDQLVIQDNGIGISPEFLPHIFEAFSQEDASRTSSYQGTGLGMSITKQLLRLMGGDIFVESELGKGSCFTILLKLNIATPEQIAESQHCAHASNRELALDGKRILLCEDHPLNAQIAIRLLNAKGMLVEHAENGKIGVDMFSRSTPGYYDAILMDIRMPVMDGVDAARAIRALARPDARCTPIIAMTANAFSDDIEQTHEVGMNAHLSKPIQTDKLYTTLNALLCAKSAVI